MSSVDGHVGMQGVKEEKMSMQDVFDLAVAAAVWAIIAVAVYSAVELC